MQLPVAGEIDFPHSALPKGANNLEIAEFAPGREGHLFGDGLYDAPNDGAGSVAEHPEAIAVLRAGPGSAPGSAC